MSAPAGRLTVTRRRGAVAAAAFALARRTTGPAERAVIAAAVADSVEVWQPLLALARAHTDDRIARAAMQWLGAARDPRARAALRTLAAADSAPEAVRAQAIFVLGNVDRDADDASTATPSAPAAPSDANAAFLRALYPRLAAPRLQDRVIQGVAQADDLASRRWLLDVAADARQPVAARKQALFWAGQQQERPITDLLAVDARLTGADMRRQYAFVLSQREEAAAVEQLITMARTDDDPAVRRQAVFWLGQSHSRRARAYLESVVAR